MSCSAMKLSCSRRRQPRSELVQACEAHAKCRGVHPLWTAKRPTHPRGMGLRRGRAHEGRWPARPACPCRNPDRSLCIWISSRQGALIFRCILDTPKRSILDSGVKSFFPICIQPFSGIRCIATCSDTSLISFLFYRHPSLFLLDSPAQMMRRGNRLPVLLMPCAPHPLFHLSALPCPTSVSFCVWRDCLCSSAVSASCVRGRSVSLQPCSHAEFPHVQAVFWQVQWL